MDIPEECKFEVALSILIGVIGRAHNEKREEMLREHPRQAKIKRLDASIEQYTKEQNLLRPDTASAIEHVLSDYGPILKNKLSIADLT